MTVSEEAVVELLRRQMGTAPEQDEEGVWSLVVDERLPLFLKLLPDSGVLFASAGLGVLPEDCEPGILRRLLGANPHWLAHSAVSVGLIPGTHSLLLSGRLGQDGSPEELDAAFEGFVRAAFVWCEDLDRLLAPDAAASGRTDAAPVEAGEPSPAETLSHLQDLV